MKQVNTITPADEKQIYQQSKSKKKSLNRTDYITCIAVNGLRKVTTTADASHCQTINDKGFVSLASQRLQSLFKTTTRLNFSNG